ncbi:D-aspartate ligase [Proteiniclasticum ruminis]|uniref:D-aspartate ligase n=2 Tax=Proteiniclasticum ruminis TaxID=398199 RepID=A0A1G8LGH8_9CLOT|nr:D-aspartate ligase [Proteiniclasticum ruminis]
MENLNLLPVLLASDINVYSMARAFHEEYNVQSLMVARDLSGPVMNSKILRYWEEKELDDSKVFLETMKKIYEENKDKTLIVIGCADHYVRLVVENKEALKDMYVVPYSDKEVLDNIVLKETFYSLCSKYNLDYAKTLVYKKEMNLDFTLDFDFPVVLKPSDSVSYNKNSFQGQHKVYFIDNMQDLKDTLKTIYGHGYEDNMIIQERIPGDDSAMYDLQVYVGSDHKVKLMNFGNVLLEEHTPKGIGSNAATLVDYNEELMKKIQVFLEDIGYEGLADCDLKYDHRDGTYKMFEINIRQGRSHYRVTGGGDNLAKYIVEDYVLHKELPLKFVKDEYFWHVVPLGIVYKYINDEEKVKKIKRLVKEGKVCHSLYYPKDMNIKRWAYLKLRDFNQYKKYKKHLG